MFGSTPIIRRLAGLAIVAGAFAALVPVAQADSGFQGEHDAVDPVAALQRAQQSATFDGREASRLELSAPAPQVRYQGEHDIVDPVLALQRVQKSAMFDGREYARLDLTPTRPDVIEQEFAAGQLQYTYQPTSSSGFDWNDFGIGAGAGIGLMLLLLGIGAGAWTTRRGQRQVSSI
jgi:type II secretory pathway pseudopilin PulG